MYPTEVNIPDASIERLTDTFKTAYTSIVKEIETATDWGVQNRKQILAQIQGILVDLGVDVQKFVQTELPEFYKSGAADAIAQLGNVGADIQTKEGFNRVHQEAIRALVDDTAKAFGESMTGVARSAQLLLGRVTRDLITQKIAEGVIGGKALKEVKAMIKAQLQEQGLDALIDKGGRAWTLDRYAEMLYRTKAVEARNRGLINRLAENDYDLVQVSSHASSCPLCIPWQGQVLSITGKTPGYTTLTEAESQGLFHPNCRHAINAMTPSLANQTKAYDNGTPTKPLEQQIPQTKTHTITVGAGTKYAKQFTLNAREQEMVNTHGLTFKVNNRMRTFGSYNRFEFGGKDYINMNMLKIGRETKEYERTLYHEMGHFLSYKSEARPLQNSIGFEHAYGIDNNAEALNVILDRLTHYKGYKGTSEADLKEALGGKTMTTKFTFNGIEGNKQWTIPASYRVYLKSKSEVFAESYSIYRTDPERLKKIAPTIHNYFVNQFEK